jgi:hypothetical protein
MIVRMFDLPKARIYIMLGTCAGLGGGVLLHQSLGCRAKPGFGDLHRRCEKPLGGRRF